MNKEDQVQQKVTSLATFYAGSMYTEVRDWIGCSFTTSPEYDSEYKRNYEQRRQLLDEVMGSTDSYLELKDLPDNIKDRQEVLSRFMDRLYDYVDKSNGTTAIDDLAFYVGQMLWAYDVPVALGEQNGLTKEDVQSQISDIM